MSKSRSGKLGDLPRSLFRQPKEVGRAVAIPKTGNMPGLPEVSSPPPGQQSQPQQGAGLPANVRRNAATIDFTTTGKAQTFLPYNAARVYLIIQNKSAGTMYVSIGGVAGNGKGIEIAAGGYYEPYLAPHSTVSIYGASGLDGVIVEQSETVLR